ncbi:MAG TPA: transcription-repair coupling factor [Phycisphaerae bacterium]
MIAMDMWVIPSITADATLAALAERLRAHGGVVSVRGLWGSSAPAVVSYLGQATSRCVLYVTAHLEDADDAREDLELFSQAPVALLPAWESLPNEGAASGEIHAERLRLCLELAEQGSGFRVHDVASPLVGGAGGRAPGTRPDATRLIVAPIAALMQPVPTHAALQAGALRLEVGGRRDPDNIVEWLVARGFERLERVESPGDFARRGDILDVFAPGESDPLRITFDDDRIESIRRFDISTQRSLTSVGTLSIAALPQRQAAPSPQDLTDFLSYLPPDTLIVLDQPAEVQEFGRTLHERLGRSPRLFEVGQVLQRMAAFDQLHFDRFGGSIAAAQDTFAFNVASLTRFEGKAAEAISELIRSAQDHEVYVVCDNVAESERLREIIIEQHGSVPESLHLHVGLLHRGFEWQGELVASPLVGGAGARAPGTRPDAPGALRPTIVVGHHEIFHRYRQRRRIRRATAGRPLESFMELEPGDFVVHATHGIARFVGLRTIRKGDSEKQEEFLTLQFAEKTVLHVPTSQIDLVQKYIGAAGSAPTLSKLGGTRWKGTKERVAQAVTDLAASMLRLQAVRSQQEGTAYPEDTAWQREFEASFIYEETEDQITVADQLKRDLRLPRPMDRLVCGDVGYGKTELAMRAAFKVVEYGKQVAVLVPTTVLAEQHYATFSERMADYPFSIACLSRFRAAPEQKRIIEAAKRGQIDIVIGTHRLLSKDVGFANLGLVIIDEEQRFGVAHKERLKHLRETVDVLTLTATPIPRTLHMALLGIRDISALATPPVDRRSIATQVRMFDPELIRSALIREMNRDGQVFFVHNFVESIESLADDIRKIVPEARIITGHGQMPAGALETVMMKLINHEADVLVCTTIIESGIDIPRANTILIDRAGRFGLADLHQLRGRVGRSKHRAYCYLLLPRDRTVTPKAAKRLKAIEEFSELGAGFRIAMRDLEIRGAGNVLGPEQSGHIAAVGYEMYCQLLERAVREIKGEAPPEMAPVHLELDVPAQIPTKYVESGRARIEIYRRIVSCRTIEDLRQLERDLQDAFGPPPKPVQKLVELAELRVLARRWKIQSIILARPDIVFTTDDMKAAQEAFAHAPGTVRMPDEQTIHLRLPEAYLEPATMLAVLRKLLGRSAVQSPAPRVAAAARS